MRLSGARNERETQNGPFFELEAPECPLWFYRCNESIDWEYKLLPKKWEFDESYLSTERIFRNGASGNDEIHLSRPVAERLMESKLRMLPVRLSWQRVA